MNRALIGLVGLTALACPSAHRDHVQDGDGPLVAIYRAVIDDGNGATSRAKLSVWAEEPDRLHAELIPPVGGVSLIVDAGGGNSCVVDLAGGTAYVGKDDPGAIEALVGVRVSAAEAVAALLHGASTDAFVVTRAADAEGVLPATLTIVEGARSISLARLRFERGATDPKALGTGLPPGRFRIRPLESLRLDR